jgi:hypothetical protein
MKTTLFVVLAVMLVSAMGGRALAGDQPPRLGESDGKTVEGRSVAPTALTIATYSGYFASNQFEPDAPASLVVISDQKQFDQVFGVAFVMGDKSHRLPKDAFQSLLVLAIIKRGKATWAYKVEGVSLKAGVVEFRYSTTETKSDSATFACPLIVSIPKGRYTAVQFVEGGKPVKKVEIERD